MTESTPAFKETLLQPPAKERNTSSSFFPVILLSPLAGVSFNKLVNLIQANKPFIMLEKQFLHHILLLQFVSLVLGKSESYRKKSKPSSGGIAGIVIGVCLIIVIFVLLILRWKRKQNHNRTNIANTVPSSEQMG